MFPTGGARSRPRSTPSPARRCWWWVVPATSRCTRWRPQSRWGVSRSTTSTPTNAGLTVANELGANAIARQPDGSTLGRYRITVDHSGDESGLQSAIRSTEAEGTCTSTAIYFAGAALPLLEMYTRGITFRTGRVNARAAIPEILELVAAGTLRPELVTAEVVDWDTADAALVDLSGKTVVTRACTSSS